MPRIALWARIRDLKIDDVERALVQKRTIVKAWSMRMALHLHRSDELRLILAGLKATRLPKETRWIEQAGLREEDTTAMIFDALKDGPITRSALNAYLGKKLGAKVKDWVDGGWGNRTEGSSTTWQLVKPAVVRGMVCFGASDGPEITFALTDQWLRGSQPIPTEEEAGAALVRRYLRAFGPADLADLRSWSGISARHGRAILARLQNELLEVDRGGRRGLLLKKDLRDLERSALPPGVVRLLPSFDPFLLGHDDRDHLVDPRHYDLVYKDQGWLAAVVLIDGRVGGTWSYQRLPRKLGVDVTMFSTFSKETRAKVKEEAHDLSRFFETPDLAIRFTE